MTQLSTYAVAPPRTGTPARTVAVFVAHGMGQQIPFQTMDAVARGLRERDGSASGTPAARAVKAGQDWLHRLELPLMGGTVEAHVYEAYWAPLTEGRITLRDVIRFLADAGLNALRNARAGHFKRWAFGTFQDYPIHARTVLYLLVTLAVVSALVVMNSTIVAVAAGTAILGSRPEWLTPGLMDDLTTTFNGVVAAVFAAGLALGAGVWLHKRRRVPRVARLLWSFISAGFLLVAVFAVVLSGAAIMMLFDAHVRRGIDGSARLWNVVAGAGRVQAFDERVGQALAWVSAIVIGLVALVWIVNLVRGIAGDLFRRTGAIGTMVVTGLFVLLAVLAYGLVRDLRAAGATSPPTPPQVQVGLVWALLVIASGFVRKVLVQYVGDVAIYVMPYKLDAFVELRSAIRKRGFQVAEAIYGMKRSASPASPRDGPLYDEVVVVGHSLGSVVAYDALNQLIREDNEGGAGLDVVRRTRLLLTFGSPLDKTAFIFSLQGKRTSEEREALAASVQPMITDDRNRPATWVNVWSPWDIISGDLTFYDNPQGSADRKVKNVRDEDAVTPIVAHTEYWQNPTVYRTIYEALTASVAPPAEFKLGPPQPPVRA